MGFRNKAPCILLVGGWSSLCITTLSSGPESWMGKPYEIILFGKQVMSMF
jgi:hypothetical protein